MLPGGDVHLAVIDVVGHGVTATKDAVAITHALRLLALQGTPLEDLVETADGLLTVTNPESQATVVAARYRPSTGALAAADGGHPPGLRIAGGDADLVPAPGIPVG